MKKEIEKSQQETRARKKTKRNIFAGTIALLSIVYFTSDEFSTGYIGAIVLCIAFIISDFFSSICETNNVKMTEPRRIGVGFLMFFIPIVAIAFFHIEEQNYMALFLTTIVSDVLALKLILQKRTPKRKPKLKERNKNTKANSKKASKKSELPKNTPQLINPQSIQGGGISSQTTQRVIESNKPETHQSDIHKNGLVEISPFSAKIISRIITDYNENWKGESYLPEIDTDELILEVCSDAISLKPEEKPEEKPENLFSCDYFNEKYSSKLAPMKKFLRSRYRRAQVNGHENTTKLKQIFNNATEAYVSLCAHYCNGGEHADCWAGPTKSAMALDVEYANAIILIYDTILMAASIGLLVFLDKQATTLKDNSELKKMLLNMGKAVPDSDIVLEKLYPMYTEFYRHELSISSRIQFEIVIAIILNNDKMKKLTKDIEKTPRIDTTKIKDMESLNDTMNVWAAELPNKRVSISDIENTIIMELKSVQTEVPQEVYLYGLRNAKQYANTYKKALIEIRKRKDKERYLRGDFSEEVGKTRVQFELDAIKTGRQFELLLANLFKKLGYTVEHTGKTGDQGADLLLRYDDKIYAVQAKFYSGALSNTPVQEVVGSLKYYKANRGLVITNSNFTKGAKELARANNVTLVDGKKLEKLVDYIFIQRETVDIIEKGTII